MDQPPQPPADTTVHYYYPEATAGKRFLNHLIDSTAACPVIAILIATGSNLSDLFYRVLLAFDGSGGLLIGYALYAVYCFGMEVTTGRTLGKLITNTRVVARSDTDPSWKQILGRTAARFIPFEPLSFLGATCSGWHDTLSKTKVIDTSRPPNVVMSSDTPMRPFNPDAGRPIKKA